MTSFVLNVRSCFCPLCSTNCPLDWGEYKGILASSVCVLKAYFCVRQLINTVMAYQEYTWSQNQ